MHYSIMYLCLHVVYSILICKYYIIRTIQVPADVLEPTQEQIASTVQLYYIFTSIPKVNTVCIVRQVHFRDGLLNKRLESFALCYSQSLLLADFKENHTLLWY
jgi:hypothetical protein